MDSPRTRTLTVDGTRLLLDGAPFPLQGLSFFNALFNPAFNASDADRDRWLGVFQAWGINTLRVWCQWDYLPPRTYVDVAPDHTLYTDDGAVRDHHFATLTALILAADRRGMVLEVTLFSQEKKPNLPTAARERGTREMTARLRPYRNLILQIWNEESTDVLAHVATAKAADPERIVTNSPGVSNVLGDEAQNRALDLLTPHTLRNQGPEPFHIGAPKQVAALMAEFGKPVIDDEPARCGPRQFGGSPDATPAQHIAQIAAVRAAGGYHIYHHDLFQYAGDAALTPPSGIPEPEFSPYHREVFAWLRDHPA